MIDRQQLENGNIVAQTRQTYALTVEDIRSDPSIIEILRGNLKSTDPELLEITIMRLGIRASDFESIDVFFHLFENNVNASVRSSILAALSSLHFKLHDLDAGRARDILDHITEMELTSEEANQAKKQFERNFKAKGIHVDKSFFQKLAGKFRGQYT